jgi:uncharacterized protein YxjI
MRCNACGADNPQDAKFCALCGKTIVAYPGQGTAPQQANQRPSIWFQNYYRIRKKVLAITNQYWIENAQGNVLGYTKQKLFRLKEDIRVFTDESMSQELFKIVQRHILDVWGTFAVIDSSTNVCVGMIKRSISSAFLEDEYYILDPNGQQIGRVIERTGRGLARKFVPLGNLVPEQVKVEFYGQQVAEIKQQFKIIGDIWEVDCTRVPRQVDRRVLLAGMILMGMIERDRK